MGVENNSSIKIPKGVFWGIIAFILSVLIFAPLTTMGSKLYEQGYKIVIHDERIRVMEENYKKIDKKLDTLLNTVGELARRGGDSD